MKQQNGLEFLLLTRVALFISGFLALSLTACDKDDNDDVVEPAAVYNVSLYKYNASPDAAPIDVFFDERRVNFSRLCYTNYTSYLNFLQASVLCG